MRGGSVAKISATLPHFDKPHEKLLVIILSDQTSRKEKKKYLARL